MSCPICQNKADKTYRPFCSKRCADLDLGRWVTGAYAIASDDHPEVEAIDDQELQRPH